MKSHRSYSDHEIACYVLGLDMPDQSRDIQARLAQDDAAAARALKWETYFLGIVDALQPAPPPATVIARIQATLGMEGMPMPEEPRPAPVHAAEPDTPSSPQESSGRLDGRRWRIGRHRITAIAAACVAAGLLALVIGANLHHTTSKVVQQPVQLETH